VVKVVVALSRSGTIWQTKDQLAAHIVVRQQPGTEDALRSMVKDLVSGLSALHDQGFIHRNIEFANIVYDRSRNQYTLIDFEDGGLEQRGKAVGPSDIVLG
jgi:serine/threonine protein kinase